MYDDLNIAVIGDIMLDHWREGTEYKLNPESPTVDIINPTSEYTLGGAGNVARIVRGLGARVQLLGVAGDDTVSNEIEILCDMANIGIYLPREDRRTTVKERVVCNGQQICRISEEDTRYISADTASKLVDYIVRHSPVITSMAKDLDGIIVADYSKGVMCDQLIHAVMRIAKENDIPVLVDPKDRLYIYKGCTIMKPNQKEYNKLADEEHPGDCLDALECNHFVITRDIGIKWWSANRLSGQILAHPVEVANVSGAGDAVAAVLLMEYIKNGGDIEGAVELANWGASKVVQQERTGHLTIEDLEEFYK